MRDTELIVRTKLDTPQVKGKILHRDRLLNILRQNLDKKLILICADAGYGKTTLLAQFCQEIHDRCVFYDLDSQDSDVSTFFNTLIAGVRRHAPRFGQRVKAVLSEKRGNDTVAGTFINEFVENVRDEFFFVFDDYHRLRKDRKIANIINYILRHLPANLHFVISSRTTPPIYLSYYLAKQELLHLDKEHLQFDIKETRTLLHDLYELEMNDDDIMRIAELSEGWVTVIQLILQKISATPEVQVKETLNTFVASGEDVFDYFAQEVFQNQTKTVRDFLIRTSILEYLNHDICDSILGIQGSEQIISRLETEHIFVLRTGDNVLYHPLFQEFLLKRLGDSRKGSEVKKLHIAASDYFLRQQDYSSAVHHLVSSRQYARAAKILQKHHDCWSSLGESTNFVQLTEKLPESCIEKYPYLRLKKAGMYFELMKVEKGLKDVDKAMKRLRRSNDRRGIAKAYSMKALASHCLMHTAKSLYYAKKAYSLAGKRRSREKAMILMQLGTAYRVLGMFPKAQNVFRQALEMARILKDDSLEVLALQGLGMLFYNMSEFKEAERIFMKIVTRFHDQIYPLELAFTHRNIASIAIDNGNVARALHYIERSASIAQHYTERYLNSYLMLLKGRVSVLQGDYEKAVDHFREVIDYNRESDVKISDLYAALDLVDAHLKMNDIRSARKQLDFAESVLAQSQEIPQHVIAFNIAKGRVEIAQGEFVKAQASLESALRMSKKVYDPVQVMAIYYALSEQSLARKNLSQALEYFEKCLVIAQQYGFETYLVLQGRADMRLFELAFEKEFMTDFLLNLIQLIDTDKARDIVSRFDVKRGSYDFECRYFGPFEMRDAGGSVITPRWRTNRTKTIFVVLSINHPKGCTKEMLADICWPRKKVDQAVRSLQVEISSLRKLLDRLLGARPRSISSIMYRDSHYTLAPRFVIKRDVTLFEKLVHEAMAMEAIDRQKSMQSYAHAVEIYRGDFCEGLAEEWCSSMRSYYREMILNVLKKLARLSYDEQDHEKALLLYRRAQGIDRYDETLHIGVMRCLAALKDSEGVQRQYQILTKTLRDLDITLPSQEATKIYQESLK
ncbi:MAG: tetratricopeptide repeat protein [candidate division WOR-3 bacterium]|nr:tetratricopeptide repeat protein [candidate division WOR-3 bacterium]